MRQSRYYVVENFRNEHTYRDPHIFDPATSRRIRRLEVSSSRGRNSLAPSCGPSASRTLECVDTQVNEPFICAKQRESPQMKYYDPSERSSSRQAKYSMTTTSISNEEDKREGPISI
jgi:hypothetical protein